MPIFTVSFFCGGREGSPTKSRLQKKVGALILTSLLEDLEYDLTAFASAWSLLLILKDGWSLPKIMVGH